MGTPEAAVPTLERIIADGHQVMGVFTQPDRPSGRGNKIVFSPVKSAASDSGLPVFQPTKLRDGAVAEQIRKMAAEVIVVVAYGRILPDDILASAPRGAINVHFSLLPKYRGAAPVNWALVNGEKETGVTIMKMDAGLDTGDILMTEKITIYDHETAQELMARSSVAGADLLSRTLAQLDAISPTKQNDEDASYAPILKKSDGLIDWELSADAIERRVRGFQPFPGTFTFLEGKRIVLKKVEVVANGHTSTAPGMIQKASGEDLIVACGRNTSLSVLELQPEGKRTMSAREFLNGSSVHSGVKFENAQ